MSDRFIEPPLTPSSLPGKAGELSYGPDLIPQPGYGESPYSFQSLPSSSSVNPTDPFEAGNEAFRKSLQQTAKITNPFAAGAPTPFNAEATMFDRFASSWDFADKGFIPWRDNDDVYNQDTNILKELYRSSKWAAPLLGEGFVSGLRTFPDLIGGMYNMDLDQILQTDDQLAEKWSRATKMGGSTAGGVSSFVTNFEISAANMIGMGVEVLVEDALIGYITAQSGGATTPAAFLAAGKTASVFSSIYKGLKNLNKIGDVFKEAKNARRLWEITENGAKVFAMKAFDFANPLQQTIGGFKGGGFLKDLYRGEEYIKNSSVLGNTVQGFGAFYRDLREINFALTEAKLEGGFSYIDRKDEMTNAFIAKNGYAPQGEDAQKIEKNARAGSDFTTQANLPIIYYSNRIGFGNLFKGFTPLNKLMSEVSAGDSLFKNIRFNNAAKLFEEAKGFSLKTSFRKGLGNSISYFKANAMEGIQENLQETIQGASKDYYDKQFKDPTYGTMSLMMGDIYENLKNQASAQGVSTFLSGALMGGVMAGGIKIKSGIQNLTYRITNKEGYKEFKEKRTEQINKYITQLNEIYANPTEYLDPELMNAVRQGALSKYLSQAVANGNKKQFYDIKDQSVYEHLWTLVRSGKSEIFKDKLEEMKQLSPEEFENALGFKVEKPEEFKSYIDDQVRKIDQIQKMYDKANEKLPNPVNLGAFKKGTPEYISAANQYYAFENAKQQAVFANYSFMRNAERMSGLLSEMTNQKMFGKQIATAMGRSSYLDLSMLSEPNLLNAEMSTLKKEIQSLSQGDAESVKLANEKDKRLKALEKWKEVMESGEIKGDTTETEGSGRIPRDWPSADNPAYEAWRNTAKLAFENLVNVEASINKDSTYREAVNEVFNLLMDYHTLGRESKGLMEVVNILADPANFLKLYKGHFTVIEELYRKKQIVLKEAIDKAILAPDQNSLIKKLADIGFVEDPEQPGTYFRIADKTIVEPGSEDAAKIEEIVKDHEAATKEEPESEKEEKEAKEDITSSLNIRLNKEQDAYLIDHEGITYQVWKDEPTLFFKENEQGTLDTVESTNVPDIVKSELDKFIKAQQPVPAAPKPADPVKPALKDLLEQIAETPTIEELMKNFDDYLIQGTPKYNLFSSEAEQAAIGAAYERRFNVIQGLIDVEEDSDVFKSAYAKAFSDVKVAVKKPGITEKDIVNIFNSSFAPVINLLRDPAVKAKYTSILRKQVRSVITKFNNNKRSKDLTAAKVQIDNIFKTTTFFSDIDAAVQNLLMSSVSEEIKQDVIDYFLEVLKKKFDKEIKDLEEASGTVENDEILKKYINSLREYKAKVEESLERFTKQAEEVKAKTAGINLLIDVESLGFINNVHYDKTNKRNYAASDAQHRAIRNLVAAGVLDANYDLNLASTSHGASELINEAVARIHIIGINKGIYSFLKTGDISFLEKEYEDYLTTQSKILALDLNEIKEEVSKKIEDVKLAEKTTTSILEVLDLTGAEDLSDEQFKALKEVKNSIYKVQSESLLLEGLQQIEAKTNKYLAEGAVPESLDEFLDEDTVGVIKPLLKKEQGTKFDIEPFYNDLLEVIEKIQRTKEISEAEKLIKKLATKYTYPSKTADAANIIRAFVGSVLEVQALTSGEIQLGEELTNEEIVRILNGEKRTLTPSQMKQVEDYQKDVIELLKGKMSNSPSYEELLLEPDEEGLPVLQSSGIGKVKYLALRPKDAADVRTAEDLAAEYEVVDGKINTKKALQNILESDFSTPAEKEIAKILMQTIPADSTIDVDNTMESAGQFDPETERVAIRLTAVGYKEEFPSNPIETVILHELLHGQIERAIEEPNGAYKTAIKSLYAAVKTHPAAKSFYAMQDMSEDEQLREFVIEAFTNPDFQYLLAKIPYAKSGKSAWQKFVEVLSNLLKSIGIDIEGSVLNEVINQTTELIKFDYTEKALDKLSKVETLEQIAELEQEVNQEASLLSPAIQESMNSALTNKRNSILAKQASILAKQVNTEAKAMTQVKIDGKTYYFKTVDGEIQLFKKTNKRLIRVRKPEVIESFIKLRLEEKGAVKILGKDKVKELVNLMGDPKVQGTYASGEMLDTPLDEGRLADAFKASPVLKFESIEEFNAFRREYWKLKAQGVKSITPSMFNTKYSGRGIGSFIELASLFGGLNKEGGKNLTNQMFDRLINAGVIKVQMKGFTHEDYTKLDEEAVSYDDFVEMYEMILSGASGSASDKDVVAKKINKIIASAFGVDSVSKGIQSSVEQAILAKQEYSFEEDLEQEPPAQEETKEEDVPFTSIEPKHKKGKDPSAFDASLIDPENTITAVNTNALRSYAYDLDSETNEENSDFTLYYYKVRKIINNLSLKSLKQLSDLNIFITLRADTAGLRWDGSAENPVWIKKPKGVIGYLSDNQGNPYIFDQEGNIMGTLDKDNLSDKKGLDNDVNQIVYFNTITKDSKTPSSKKVTPESKKQLLEAREKAAAGKPQIAQLVGITQGIMNNKSLVRASAADQGSTKEPYLKNALNQPNVTFSFNQKGDLLAVITDEKGAVNTTGLFPPKTKNVVSDKDSTLSLYIHLIDTMVTIKEMKLSGKDTTKLEKEYASFVRKMWLSGEDRKLNIKLGEIQIKSTKGGNFETYELISIKDGKVVRNEENIEKAKNLLNEFYINISRDWWTGEVRFKFPIVDVVNGEKVVRFVEHSYKNFLFNKVGLKSNTTEITPIENLMRYNSIIVFTNPTDIAEQQVPPIDVTEKNLLDNPNAIKDGVDDAVKASGDTSTENKAEIDALKKKKKFYNAPSYDQIFEKTCK